MLNFLIVNVEIIPLSGIEQTSCPQCDQSSQAFQSERIGATLVQSFFFEFFVNLIMFLFYNETAIIQAVQNVGPKLDLTELSCIDSV